MKQHSLPKTLLALVALTACLITWTGETKAQQYNVPYNATVYAGMIPQEWVTSNNYGPIEYNGLNYYAFSTGTIVLPELNAPTSTLTVDVIIEPFVNPVFGSSFIIGYMTDINDYNTFTPLHQSLYQYELPWPWNEQRCKRVVLSGVPDNARIALTTIYEWFIQSVRVYETPEPFDVPYSISTFQSGLGQNAGWVINDYSSYNNFFLSGTSLLPEFNSALNLLEMDVLIKPYDYSAQNIQVGYVTNPNSPSSNWNFVSVQSYNASSSWTGFMPKRISYSSAPSGARMAIRCNGRWEFNNINVYNPASTVYTLPYQYSFGQTLPGGWLSNNYGYYDGAAFLTDGIAVLPNFQYDTWRELELDLAAMPRNSQARNIKIGYITDPNDPSTFMDVQTFYNNTSAWTEMQPKRVDYAGIAAGARLAIQCNGDWNIRDVAVRYKPSTIYPTQSNPYHLATFDANQPEGWIANSYVNEGRFKTGVNQLPRLNSAVSINSLFLDVDIKPSASNINFSVGYVTTSQAVTTFTALKTFSSSTDWTDFRIQRLDFNDVPSGARMAISFAGEWTIRDVKLYPTPSPTAVPYNPTLGESQPEGWMANNYAYSSGEAYLNNGLAILPQFNAEISTLLLDIALKPKNSSANNIKIGYVTNPNDPSTFVATHTFINSSWNDYLPKRMQFVSAPTGARMAIQSNGDWNIAGVSVKATNSVQTVFDVPYNLPMTYTYPEGWIANNCSYTSNGFCFNSGTAVLPQFNATLSTLQMDIQLTPASGAQSIQIGYVTNPNNPSATFVALQTFNNSSTWNHPLKRVSFYGLNDNVRLAIKCNGTWMVSSLTVYSEPTPLDVPYYNSNNDGWIENISYHDYYMYPIYQSGCAILPRFNAPIGALQLNISFRTWNSDAQNLSIGYITNPNDLSTFTVLQTYTVSSIGSNLVNKTISYFGVPTNARMAFVCEGTWAIGLAVTMPSISIPYTQGFEGMDVGSIPNGWYSPDMSVQGTYNSIAPHGGTKQLAGKGYIVLPVVENADYSALTLSLYARPEMTNYGGRIRVGYIPNGGALSQFVEIKNVTWNTNLSDYQQISASLAGIPADARLALYCFGYSSTANLWHLDDISIKPAETIPYTQPFATNSAPDGWSTYVGRYQESTHTANLTPNTGNSWHFGEANGVFDSHAYATLGDASSNECRWLISPPISLGEANGVFLSFDIAMSRESGNQVPLTPGEQENQRIFVLVTNDGGATWNEEMGWCGQMCGLPDLNVLNPDGNTYYHPLGNYQGQTIQVAFYAECFNGNDNNNRVHIDNVNVQSHDVTGAPTSVTVSEVGGHSAKVSWTPASSMQYHWDLWVPDYGSPYNGITIEYMQGNGYYQHLDGYLNHVVTGLEPNDTYRAWVRYNDGITVGEWASSDWFDTETMCAVPTNLQVVVTQHTALVTWDPGQSNQTSWYTYGGTDDMDGETVYEPFRLLTGLEPGEEYEISVTGYCEDGDGDSETISTTFTTQPKPSLTANDDDDTNDDVPITNDNCGSKESRTQFIIPASQLIDMQYSHLQSLTFESGYIGNGQPWGEDASFKVYLKVVSQNDFSDSEFYDWDELYCIGSFRPTIHNHLMTFSLDDYHQFYYTGGNLLVGFYQEEYDFTPGQNFGHVDWLGVNNYNSNPNYKPSIYYNIYYEEPFAQTFAPKVTFSYEPDDYLPPTNFVVNVTGPDEIVMTWTPRAGQTGAEVELLDEDMESIDIWTAFTNPFGIGELEYATTYYVRIRAKYYVDGETHYSAWTAPVEFTTLDLCDAPDNLQVNEMGPFTATLTWDSSAAYDEVEYRELATQWEEGFEGGATSVPAGWAQIVNGTGSSAGRWKIYEENTSYLPPHTGSHHVSSFGIQSAQIQTDNWLVLPQIELGGVLKFWASTIYGEQQSFSVYVSTTGATVADFGSMPILTGSPLSYQEYTVDLSGYEGLGFIAIRHQHAGADPGAALGIDDVTYLNGGDWTSLGYVEGGQYDFEGLTPGTTYQARVRSMCEVGDASYLGYWTDPVGFSTPGNIVFQDPVAKSASVYLGDTNGDGELSYAEAAAITDLTLIFKDQVEMQYFNELQYFTGLTAIGDNAFSGCVNLSAITLPPTITSIGYYAFGYSVDNQGYPVPCSSLHNIVIPPSVTTIGDWAFCESGLTAIDLPYSVTTVGTLAFGDCNSLVSVYLPATVTSISDNAFTGSSIASIEVDAGNPVYDSRNGCNAIIHTQSNTLITGCKNTVVPYGVTAIGGSAFENCTGLTDITLPVTVETLGDYAFLRCTGLSTIEVEATTPPTIGQATFGNLTLGNIKVYVPCGSLETYQDSDWSGFDLVENCNIVFEDYLTKELCVNTWDRNFDGELSYREAAAVTSLNNEFYGSNITRFNELQYFTGLTSIGEEDFGDCERLVAVTLPPTVTQIYNYAFENCTSLTSITFGENIGIIWDYAFSGCDGLWFIKVEATTPPSLGEEAFNGADTDIPVYVPCGTKTDYQNDSDWNTIFADYNFIDMCDTIYFADAAVRAICLDNWDTNNDGHLSYGEAAVVTDLGEVFQTNFSIQTFNELAYFTGLTEIGDNAFLGCIWLNSVALPITITSIGTAAFYNTYLTDIYIPDATRTIGWLAFGSCNRLASVYIPASVTYIEGNPFSNCPALNNIWVDSGNPVYDSRNNCKAIIETATNTLVTGGKNTVIPDDVTALGSYAFSGQTTIASITLPTSIASLGNGVFENCTGLTVVNVQAETPPTLGYNVFDGVPDDVVINIPCGTKAAYTQSWAPYAANLYDGCAYIEFADANVKAICVDEFDLNGDEEISYDEAAAVTGLAEIFRGNATITSFDELQYFTNVTSIDAYAFNGCRALTSITLPPAITSIGNYAFVSCQVLTSLALPSTLTSIGSSAFGNCYALTTIELPNGLTSIGSSAFMNSGLTSVAIPASVTDIGTNPFRSCSALESITVDPENSKYDSRDGCNAIIYTSTLGSNTRTNLISGCKNTVIPDGVTAINGYAFAGITELTSITLPGSLTTISYYAFQNCTGLQSITVLATTPPSLNASSPFDLVPTDIPVYVPCGTLEDYQAAEGWSDFTNIVDPCATVTQTIELAAGVNWVSFYVETDLDALKASLQATGGTNIVIQAKNGSTTWNGRRWLGTVSGFSVIQMYKIQVPVDCEIAIEGMPLNPAELPIIISNGANWIGFPYSESMSLADAFTGFSANQDAVSSKGGSSTWNGRRWLGSLSTLVPGQGYIYNSKAMGDKILIFPTSAK